MQAVDLAAGDVCVMQDKMSDAAKASIVVGRGVQWSRDLGVWGAGAEHRFHIELVPPGYR